jgi:hypothetical protein
MPSACLSRSLLFSRPAACWRTATPPGRARTGRHWRFCGQPVLSRLGETSERWRWRWDRWLQWVGVGDVDVGGAAGQREDAVDVWAAAHEDQAAAGLPSAESGVDDGVHRGTVHEGELAQVQDGQSRL